MGFYKQRPAPAHNSKASGIDYAAIAKAGGIGKGRSCKSMKARKDREDAKQLKAFRDAVWKREWEYLYDSQLEPGQVARGALCQHCHDFVSRFDDEPLTGEVHHRIFRGNKATRYDPDNGVLLCNHLVNGCHEKAERKLIQV